MARTALKAGGRFKSATSEAQVMVIKAPAGEFDLSCGGAPMVAMSATETAAPDAADTGEALIGKRYVNADESLELLCTKGGRGTLKVNCAALAIKQAKQLPSSD
ncbi:MAG: hypothetical protein EPN72_06270 [Nevskiaceae bacterium]|nr:MAG: hypothetical protein EPN63_02925 [Nevskiaceae bacterium]TBR73733.1 MAG: hypothetical protein EPN72_06270 [Nevskiaceae bacterium]